MQIQHGKRLIPGSAQNLDRSPGRQSLRLALVLAPCRWDSLGRENAPWHNDGRCGLPRRWRRCAAQMRKLMSQQSGEFSLVVNALKKSPTNVEHVVRHQVRIYVRTASDANGQGPSGS